MGMQTDVKSGYCPVSATTVVTSERTRLKGLVISYPSGGTVVVKDGEGGPTIYEFVALAVIGSICVVIPGEGILAANGIAVTTAAATTVSIFYG